MSSGGSKAYNEPIEARSFERFAAAAALATAVAGIAYAITFIAFERSAINDLLLLLVSLLALPVFVALYQRLRDAGGGWALLGLLLGAAGAYGGAAHGTYDLANRLNEPEYIPGVPYPADPRGFATFALTGLAILVFASLMRRDARFPDRLSLVGYALGVLLVIVFLGRLIALDEDDVVVAAPAALAGLVAAPLWYAWLGRELRRARG